MKFSKKPFVEFFKEKWVSNLNDKWNKQLLNQIVKKKDTQKNLMKRKTTVDNTSQL